MKRLFTLLFLLLLAGCITAMAQGPRVITATETTGQLHDFTTLTDSVVGQICSVNEDSTACNYSNPFVYSVPSSMIAPAFQANGGTFGVDMLDAAGSDTPNNLSDQLYLKVGPQDPLNLTNTLQWCWDSDLEPNVNICQRVILPSTLVQIVEPPYGTMNLTGLFDGSNGGPLAAGQWQVTALSETPEPSTFLMLGSGLVGLAGVLRRKLML